MGPKSDLHSGRFGGTVANPVHALATILASLHDEQGRITVDGFYDGVDDIAEERRAEIAAVAFDDADYCDALGVSELHGEAGLTTLERLWERPTLEITGVSGGGKYSVIPHTATGHIVSRLVGRQDPEHIARHHRHVPSECRASTSRCGSTRRACRRTASMPAIPRSGLRRRH